MNNEYVHGYSEKEGNRLVDQATTLTTLLHADTQYPAGSRGLEAGCGVGAQTITLAANSPEATFVAVDISADSLAQARFRLGQTGSTNVHFQQADLLHLPFPAAQFDHVFLCFVLEHLANPDLVLAQLHHVLKPGGSLTVIEGDHGSAFFHPDSALARQAIQCLIDLQRQSGGDSLIGRRLYPLLVRNGFQHVSVSPRFVYADDSRPAWVDGFIRRTFTAMVEGVGPAALRQGLMDEASWARGIRDLYRTAEPDGSFCYTFFKAVAFKYIPSLEQLSFFCRAGHTLKFLSQVGQKTVAR
jgi:SAM-dependent methyltransferase